ncbi:MAG: citrate (Si)-synthase, partial [Hyphomicrobium sp.]
MNIHDKAAKGTIKPSATLTVENKQVELSVRSGTIGPDVIDVANLYKETGHFTYDPGFTS